MAAGGHVVEAEDDSAAEVVHDEGTLQVSCKACHSGVGGAMVVGKCLTQGCTSGVIVRDAGYRETHVCWCCW
jgi:hypothetical protein